MKVLRPGSGHCKLRQWNPRQILDNLFETMKIEKRRGIYGCNKQRVDAMDFKLWYFYDELDIDVWDVKSSSLYSGRGNLHWSVMIMKSRCLAPHWWKFYFISARPFLLCSASDHVCCVNDSHVLTGFASVPAQILLFPDKLLIQHLSWAASGKKMSLDAGSSMLLSYMWHVSATQRNSWPNTLTLYSGIHA